MIVEEKEAYFYNCARSHSELCSGSRCMAWRWAAEGRVYNEAMDDMEPGRSTTHGYCGLAGRP